MRPVLRGLVSYESLITPGVLTLCDIARLNEAISAENENQYRAHAAAAERK